MKIFLVLLLCLSTCDISFQESHEYTDDFVIEIDGDSDTADRVARSISETHGFRVLDKVHFSDFGHVFYLTHTDVSVRSKRSAEDFVQLLNNHPKVKYAEQQTLLVREKREILHDKQDELESDYYEDKSVFQRFNQDSKKKDGIPDDEDGMGFNDPFYRDMWYLHNTGQAGGPVGLDINVVPAWKKGIHGEGVVVCILDDGVDHMHLDLKNNYDPEASTDLDDRGDPLKDPEPNLNHPNQNSHGTKCAGEIAAEANNEVCGVGVAYKSKIGGIRLLDGRVTDMLEARGLTYKNNYIHIYSASWGPRDDGKTLEAPHKYAGAALKDGAEKGRNGLGSIFMWATGNGGKVHDCCNADGYVSSPYTLSIGSINNYAQSTYFTESCPSQLAVIYTGGFHSLKAAKAGRETHPILKVITTDVGDRCTLNFQGTSSAAPMAAGCMALVLQANPNITWRDAQHIIVETAKIPNAEEPGWTINGAGKHVNPKFGFGVMDCGKMVEVAQNWQNVPARHVCEGDTVNVDKDLKSKGSVTSEYVTDGCRRDPESRIDKLEHVQIHVRMSNTRRGDVQIFLTSPAGTRSEMLSPRKLDASDDSIDFTFMSVHKWGENPTGTWKLEIRDNPQEEGRDNSGHVDDWKLILSGFAAADDDATKKNDAVTNDETSDDKQEASEPGTHKLTEIMAKEQQQSETVQIDKAKKVKPVPQSPSADEDNSDSGDLEDMIDGLKDILKSRDFAELDINLDDLQEVVKSLISEETQGSKVGDTVSKVNDNLEQDRSEVEDNTIHSKFLENADLTSHKRKNKIAEERQVFGYNDYSEKRKVDETDGLDEEEIDRLERLVKALRRG